MHDEEEHERMLEDMSREARRLRQERDHYLALLQYQLTRERVNERRLMGLLMLGVIMLAAGVAFRAGAMPVMPGLVR